MSRIKALGNELAKLITRGVRERRRHVRVKYPPLGVIGDLPAVEIAGQAIIPINLSQDGLLVSLPDRLISYDQEVAVKIIWKYGPLIFNHEAKLIRRNVDRHHFKFTKTDCRAFIEFSKSFDAGIRGAETLKMGQSRTPPYLDEYWLGPSGEKILFQKNEKGNIVDIFFMDHRITWNTESGLLREEKNEKEEWRFKPAKVNVTDEVVIFLTNIIEPSEKIERLLKAIMAHHYQKS